MEKLYYSVELRIGEINDEQIRKKFYFSDGYVIISEGSIEGYLTKDLLLGYIQEDEIYIEFLNFEEILNSEEGEEYKSFDNIFECIEIPGKFYMPCNIPEFKKQYAILSFIKQIKDISQKEMIENNINQVKKIHNFS